MFKKVRYELFIMLKKAVELIKENGNKKTIIIFDTDGDGIGAATILAKIIKRIFNKIPEVMPVNHNSFFMFEEMFYGIKNKKFDFIITVDIAADEKPEYILKLSKKSKMLIKFTKI